MTGGKSIAQAVYPRRYHPLEGSLRGLNSDLHRSSGRDFRDGPRRQRHPVHRIQKSDGLGKFFLPGKVLGAKFRGKFLALLRSAFRRGELELRGTLAPLQEHRAFDLPGRSKIKTG